MKKAIVVGICNTICFILLIGFIVKTTIDYSMYSAIANSAPFNVFVLVNAICFIVPALIVFFVGVSINNKL